MCRLASYVLQRPAFSKDEKLVSTLVKKLIAVAALEKQAAAIEDLSGMGLPLHSVMIQALSGAMILPSGSPCTSSIEDPGRRDFRIETCSSAAAPHSMCRAHAGEQPRPL